MVRSCSLQSLWHIIVGCVLGAALVGSLSSWRAASLAEALDELQIQYAKLQSECQVAIPDGSASSELESGVVEIASKMTVGSSVRVQGQTTFLWPAPLQLVPLATSSESGPPSLTSFDFCDRLTTAAIQGLARFEVEIQELPLETEDFIGRNKLHHAFARLQENSMQGTDDVRKGDGRIAISSFGWFLDEVANGAVRELRRWAIQLSARYLQNIAGIDVEGELSDAFRVVVWAEILGHSEMLLPRSDSGALVSGAMWARKDVDGDSRWVFEDPRSINAPFGRRYEVSASEGTLVMFPPWLSFYVEPGGPAQKVDSTLWRFLVWPAVPKEEWSWVDDPASSVLRRESIDFGMPRESWIDLQGRGNKAASV